LRTAYASRKSGFNVEKVKIAKKFTLFRECWVPYIVGELNDHYVKVAKLKGQFVWHKYHAEDELFLVTKGRLLIDSGTKTCG
jgi:mannose-6-phosphate isomerase-like protein (cupin superfamily)